MKQPPTFAATGTKTSDIDVRLSYRIVELFSEGLYSSPNKAIEELVANSFDAGAQRVAVFLPADFHSQDAAIGVLDDGEGMDAEGLRRHWLIGISNKRDLTRLPKGRQQIGKFGIGKLATYVLASRLTHISKHGGKFYSTSMDYGHIDKRVQVGIEPKTPIKIALRQLTEAEAQGALSQWTKTAAFQTSRFNLFGKDAAPSWTYTILSDLKPKVHEIRRGTLEWVLRTALPLRDDFVIILDGRTLESSKARKGRLKKWVLGKDLLEIPKPAPDDIEATEHEHSKDIEKRFGLTHKGLGRITGYAEAYKDLLTGKSDDFGRSHGFFVYVHGRLINVVDGHFGIQPNELRHGTFGRIRVVVHMDGLDAFLQSDRERIREGPILADAQNILRGIFNLVRAELTELDEAESSGAKLARKMAGSPASLSRRPLIDLAKAALDGNVKARYIALPPAKTRVERERVIAELEKRAETPEEFIAGVDISSEATSEDPIAVYDAATGRLRVNSLHPFIGAFFDEFVDKSSGLPLEVFAMAEVLLESHLFGLGLGQEHIDSIMATRDQLLRHTARESGRMTPLMVAHALRNARNDQDQLEVWVVEAFRSLGFEATRVGKSGNPDGVAEAILAPDSKKQPQRYKVSLEAKSKQRPDAAVSAKSVGVSTVARHRKKYTCQHAVVVGQLFPTTKDEQSALAKEIAEDRSLTEAANKPGTITLIHIDDLAELVRIRPLRSVTLQRIRELFRTCSLPNQCKSWIQKIVAEQPARHDYPTVVKTIARLQSGPRREPVEFGELRAELRHGTPKLDYEDLNDLRSVCRTMAALAPDEVEVTDRTVALNQGVPNVLAKLNSATKAHGADTK